MSKIFRCTIISLDFTRMMNIYLYIFSCLHVSYRPSLLYTRIFLYLVFNLETRAGWTVRDVSKRI